MIRAKAHEKFSDQLILQSVIDALESANPITKKAACEKLNIAYNVSRLSKIIDEFKHKKELDATIRKSLRNKPFSAQEKKDIISSYLAGEALASISEYSHRSIQAIKNLVKTYNVPFRDSGITYFNPLFLEDDSSADDYSEGDLVYSARYNCAAYIRKKLSDGVYSLWTTGDYSKSITQPFYELADLRKLQTSLGIEIPGLSHEEYMQLLIEAMTKANKRTLKK